MMTTSTELHMYQREERMAKVFQAYEGFYVEFYKNNVMVERREMYSHSETYAENAAENYVDGVMQLNG
jgi:ABC-type polar amino acid transport system ATPase subunit|tara:strand:- start:76 stop:279 length:204 start_codon:yes stop_codon:yes gene_type:complete